MSPKPTSVFICQNCEAQFPKWQGRCEQCGEWNTLVEQQLVKSGRGGKSSGGVVTDTTQRVKLSEVSESGPTQQRLPTGFSELDRVLGGGIVPGAVMLIGGEPGIGKSTLLTQVVLNLLLNQNSPVAGKGVVAYISGEESPQQITLRIKRILEKEHKKSIAEIGERLVFLTATNVDEVVQHLREIKPQLAIVDSIQTLSTQELMGAAGSAGQVREGADRLTQLAKNLHIPMFLVGHVTKEGDIAGPKVLEHIVDAVLELSGERTDELRIIRAIKNRFGATDEVGVFRIVEQGLAEVSNPSELFLGERPGAVAGSATVCVMEGTRPLLIEVQALVVGSQLAMPRRIGRGIELSRIQVLTAILQKHCGLPLGTADVFVSAAGGLKLREPAVDLGLAVAIASSLKGKSVPTKTVFIGEVGLLGEVRSVNYLERRIKEAQRLGFTQIVSRQSQTTVRAVLKELGLL